MEPGFIPPHLQSITINPCTWRNCKPDETKIVRGDHEPKCAITVCGVRCVKKIRYARIRIPYHYSPSSHTFLFSHWDYCLCVRRILRTYCHSSAISRLISSVGGSLLNNPKGWSLSWKFSPKYASARVLLESRMIVFYWLDKALFVRKPGRKHAVLFLTFCYWVGPGAKCLWDSSLYCALSCNFSGLFMLGKWVSWFMRIFPSNRLSARA